MIYSVFHLLKQYQQTVSNQLEYVTLSELKQYATVLEKEGTNHDVSGSYHNDSGSFLSNSHDMPWKGP